MNIQFNKPKGFSEILDHTFSLSKNRFKDFYMILLILMGPVYVIQALMQLFSGVSFFRQLGSGDVWYKKILSGLIETEPAATNIGSDIGIIITGIISFLLLPIAEAAILLAMNRIRRNEEYTIQSVIKEAFSRFWPIIGSTILFAIITFGLIATPFIIIALTGVIGSFIHPAVGIVFSIILILGFAVLIGYLLTRWSFYFGSVVLDHDAPGLTNSWRLAGKRTWILMALYVLFFLIISCISSAVEITFSLFLGNSVLLSIIVNLVTLFTTMILCIGYGIMYFDLKTRHDADDLKELIDDFHQ
ncbi:hypothetical protein F7731_20455 [Cytobacillus depressus]|uniref:Glycerophosphoryl diester phosphodiesterase membrane domain-containing protein n=1 Tax=Cytobacillus depressus TaxID=1602942 RepID=A0A6L3V019_9BACI|nr:hypothetical protein [Cytobacillus depressus]KAB2330160.1 hypothetical protein F7731_20455 [Cytobacillus depressus]